MGGHTETQGGSAFAEFVAGHGGDFGRQVGRRLFPSSAKEHGGSGRAEGRAVRFGTKPKDTPPFSERRTFDPSQRHTYITRTFHPCYP